MVTLNQVCYRTFDHQEPWTLQAYEAVGGYRTWRRVLAGDVSPEDIISEVKLSGLRGRGGAGFPAGIKWGFIQRQSAGQKYLVCNSDEGEPGTSKDRWILEKNPHQLLEGMALAAYAMGMSVVYNYLRGEFHLPFVRCEQALKEAMDAGLLGRGLGHAKIDCEIHHVLGAGSYIVGEETAMLESLEGKKAQPRNKPPFPANYGLYGCPTTVNNTETLASVPVIMEKGGQWFAGLGVKDSGGTKIFSVSGHIQKPGAYEIPLGMPFEEFLTLCGGLHPGRSLKAVIPGGSSMRVVPGEKMMSATLDYTGLTEVGSAIGSGGMIILDDRTCMVDALTCMMHFYDEESCGKCTPCREGSGWVYRQLKKILQGQADENDLERLISVTSQIEGRTICAFGEAIAWPVLSFIDHFRDEFEYFIHHKKSKVAAN